MNYNLDFTLQPRLGVSKLIDKYADGQLSYDQFYEQISKLGYKTTSVFEMVKYISSKKKELI